MIPTALFPTRLALDSHLVTRRSSLQSEAHGLDNFPPLTTAPSQLLLRISHRRHGAGESQKALSLVVFEGK